VDYILMLVEKWRASHQDGADKEVRAYFDTLRGAPIV